MCQIKRTASQPAAATKQPASRPRRRRRRWQSHQTRECCCCLCIVKLKHSRRTKRSRTHTQAHVDRVGAESCHRQRHKSAGIHTHTKWHIMNYLCSTFCVRSRTREPESNCPIHRKTEKERMEDAFAPPFNR